MRTVLGHLISALIVFSMIAVVALFVIAATSRISAFTGHWPRVLVGLNVAKDITHLGVYWTSEPGATITEVTTHQDGLANSPSFIEISVPADNRAVHKQLANLGKPIWYPTVQVSGGRTSMPRLKGLLFSIPTWQLFLIVGMPMWVRLAIGGVRWYRLRHRREEGQCLKCGYDLRAHGVGERCPECGDVKRESAGIDGGRRDGGV